MDSPNVIEPGSPPAASDHSAAWEDFLDIFYAPTAVFKRRASGGFWTPLLVVMIVSSLLAFANRHVMLPIVDAEFQRGMAKAMQTNPQITPALMEQSRKIAEKVAGVIPVVAIPIMMLYMAFLAWLGTKLVGARLTWNAALTVSSFALVPRILQGVLVSVQGLLLDPSSFVSRFSIQLGPGRFVDINSINPMVAALLDHLELFSLWGIVLIAIGVAVIAKLPKSKAWALGFGLWVAATLPSVFQGWRLM